MAFNKPALSAKWAFGSFVRPHVLDYALSAETVLTRGLHWVVEDLAADGAKELLLDVFSIDKDPLKFLLSVLFRFFGRSFFVF